MTKINQLCLNLFEIWSVVWMRHYDHVTVRPNEFGNTLIVTLRGQRLLWR